MSDSKAATRRSFLSASSLAAAAFGSAAIASAKTQKAEKPIKPTVTARSAARVVGANDRINVGHIGVGGMGGSHLRTFARQSEQNKSLQSIAVCDIYKARKERAKSVAHLADKDVHHDYLELLARSDVDAVIIAVPDHWHGQMAVDALAAGKDVYLQKPMTYTIEAARLVTEAVKKYNRILQVGSQHLSMPHNHKAKELIDGGEIGPVVWAQGCNSRNSVDGEWNYRIEPEATPENLDWTRWLGSAPKRPFSTERYFRWRKYWNYSGGIATDLFYHTLAPLVWCTGAEFPSAVTASGGIYLQKDREVPDTYVTTVEYPNRYITLSASMCNGAGNKYHPNIIYGHKGTISFGPGQVIVTPENLSGGRGEPTPKVYEIQESRDVHQPHLDNFFACVRSRQQPNFPADLGYQVMVAIRLGVDAYREGKTKVFDAKTQKVVDRMPPRPGWEGDGKNHGTGTENA